jgi:hypothetical protein
MAPWPGQYGAMIYWLFAGIALLVLASSGANTRSGGADIGQVLVGVVVYAIAGTCAAFCVSDIRPSDGRFVQCQ